jgi:hypothetical protein
VCAKDIDTDAVLQLLHGFVQLLDFVTQLVDVIEERIILLFLLNELGNYPIDILLARETLLERN